ncbi:hypothetical protein TNCV_264451 [Trichonephila clavipes]|nr:hypothetical protein TNCV_264451 [Trichonephila clavipes]
MSPFNKIMHVASRVLTYFYADDVRLLPWPVLSPGVDGDIIGFQLSYIRSLVISNCDESVRHFITNTLGHLWGL